MKEKITMSKNIIIVWCFLVVTILACITTIGFKYKVSKPIIDYKKSLEQKAIIYARDNNKKNVKVSVKKLKDEGYIKTNKIGSLTCNGIIIVSYDKKYTTKERVECKE